jgi:mevalonate kinase
MAQGYGFGKAILFNEHFVVHGIPAIASAINLKTIATIEPFDGEGVSLIDNRNATKGYKEDKFEQQKESLERIMKAAGIDITRNSIQITLGGDLTAASGVGASAASCVAIARALSEYFNLGFSDERVNAIAYEGEKGYHGIPSGIDNTAATYGGLIWFKKGTPNLIEQIKIHSPVELVIGNTGLVADTKAAVARIKERKEKYPEKYNDIFKKAENLAYKAREALEAFNLEQTGKLMSENHGLLQEAGVSCSELDHLVDLAMKNGALGAKMTGGGLGGNMIALTPGEPLQDKVARAIENEGFGVIRTKIGI